jgi:signal transduction histidine kinase
MLLEQRRSEEAVEAAREERQRIARELHDVVSHNLSATILQAGAAQALVRTDPESAARLLASIQELGREAMTEMRRMLGIMRQAGETPGSAPQPRLSDLPALVTRAGELGTEVVLHVDPELPPLPAGVELSAYRIVQEALTNVRKHSDAQHVLVNVRHSEQWLEVEVTDDGRPLTSTDGQPGHGLIGMRERVALLGGEVAAGASGSEAGFRVHARLPERGGAP